MIWFFTIFAPILVLLLIGTVPIRTFIFRFSVAHSRKLQQEWRSTFYALNALITWLLVFLLIVLCLGLHWSPQLLGLRSPTTVFLTGIFFAVFTLFLLAFVAFQRWTVRRLLSRTSDPTIRSASRSMYSTFPRTKKEYLLYAFSALTAGFCEELLFRGFLPVYFIHIFPHLPVTGAMLVAALLFGFVHLRRREISAKTLVPVFGSVIMGLVYGFFYISTGSIFLSMILHALFDLRTLLLDNADWLDKAKQPEEEAASPAL